MTDSSLSKSKVELSETQSWVSTVWVIDQANSGRFLTAEALVRVHISPCGISVGQSVTGPGISPSYVFPCRYHSTALHIPACVMCRHAMGSSSVLNIIFKDKISQIRGIYVYIEL